MSDVSEGVATERPQPGMLVGNLGKPILLSKVNLVGVTASTGGPRETVSVWTRMALTSNDPLFYRVVGSLSDAIAGFAEASGKHARIDRASTVLLVIKPDDSAELWIDSAAMITHNFIRRPVPIPAGTVLFEKDVADILAVEFPHVQINDDDKVLCLLREGWRFALYFDLDRKQKLDLAATQTILGSLVRQLRYADLYAALANEPLFGQLVASGWFPFLELMRGEFQSLSDTVEAGLPLEQAEATLLAKFDDERIDRMHARWMERPGFADRALILESAVKSFKARDPVATIKTILTEVEGIMADAYHRETGEHTSRIEKLLAFVVEYANGKLGAKDTLLFPTDFARYLKDYTYAGFTRGQANTISRNSVGHGAASAEQYTMTRALQALLTVDQLAFYG